MSTYIPKGQCFWKRCLRNSYVHMREVQLVYLPRVNAFRKDVVVQDVLGQFYSAVLRECINRFWTQEKFSDSFWAFWWRKFHWKSFPVKEREKEREKSGQLRCLKSRGAVGGGSIRSSVTSKKSPNVYKSCPKMISLEKLNILTPSQK